MFIENYWSKLPEDCVKGMVKLFRKETSKSIGRIAVDEINWKTPERLQQFAQILQMVYKVLSYTLDHRMTCAV